MSNPLLASDGLPSFSAIKPEHVVPAVEQVLADNRAKLEEILADAGEESAFEAGVLKLEELGVRLHRVWAPVSHLHGVANSKPLRTAYNECLPLLSAYETDLAQDERVYGLYKRAREARGAPLASDGANRLLELALRDFHLAGVDLPTDKKQRFKALVSELSQLQARFEQNLLDSMAAWTHRVTDEGTLAGLPETTKEQAAAQAQAAGLDGWLFRLDQPTYVAVVTHAENRDLRMRLYRAWSTRASDQAENPEFDNSGNIEKILQCRHELAQLTGYANYAEYSLASKMASSTGEVLAFLDELALRSHTAARRELEALERFAGKGLAAWDIAFYSEKLRHERYAVSDEELRPFFPLDRVLGGFFGLVERLYAVRIEAVEDVDTRAPDVRYYRISNLDGGEVGGLYTDLFARENKRSGAWMDECAGRNALHGDSVQLPIAHLVCNFSPPGPRTPSLLNHDEVLTLFHEFGHTLHHVLTRVRYPSIAGINGVPWDAVELPSQFMENFAWEPEVIRMISGHHLTGEPLPADIMQKLQSSRVFQSAMQMVRQLEFALFDLRLHAEFDPRRGSRVMRILEDVRNKVAVVRHPEYNRFAHGFSHIFGGGYAAGYYSYKWAEVLAADAWSAFTERGIFDPGVAGQFRRDILEVGGSVDIAEAFREFRGRDPQLEPLLRQAGIVVPEAA